MATDKKNKSRSIFKTLFLLALAAFIFFNPLSVKKSLADGKGSTACNGVYASNPIIYALYLKARGKAVGKNEVITYIKIVNPAKYMHDRYNSFLWKKLFYEDKQRLEKLMKFVSSVKYFKEYIRADISSYNFKKHGFYLTYYRSDRTIENRMKTRRNINFIKIKHGNIYYLFHNLTVVHKNAGDFNFLTMPENDAESFINKRTGTFGHIKKSVFLAYYLVPLTAKNDILTVKVACVKAYNNKHKNLLIGVIK
ncbi:MAG: DUF4852 domain-containing protein [Deltaproteobacteria bacterium]|nr:DUF4852 domain-containing protein [Deltaproteobacteria bacterium]